MVDVDMWARVFAGGAHPAIPGHYRFRTERVYLPRGAIRVKKSSANKRVRLAKLEPAALLRTLALISDITVCSAIFVAERNEGRKWTSRAASDLHTTLVLEREPPDFSTDAGNSALIVKTKSPLRLVALSPACPAAKKNNNNEISVSPNLVSPGRERQCHGRSCLVDNSLLLPRCHPRR
jgi:hypothetical protein